MNVLQAPFVAFFSHFPILILLILKLILKVCPHAVKAFKGANSNGIKI